MLLTGVENAQTALIVIGHAERVVLVVGVKVVATLGD